MKLISLRIENFGKLSDYSYEFNESCNTICENNGWGKSTLVTFIRVMLYGFKNETKRNPLERERMKYKPWQEGIYGGTLVFEKKGEKYCLRRTFGEKPAGDKSQLVRLDTNMPCEIPNSCLGEWLYGIDMESYINTSFVSQNLIAAAATDAINGKMGDVGQLEGDISNYENAMTNFTKLINGMSPTRQTGSLYKKRMEIHELADQIRHLENVEEDLVKLENRKNDLINIQREREKDLKKALREDADADLYAATGTKAVTDSNADADSYADSGADSYDIGQDDISPALFPKILLFASIGVAGILILTSIFIYFYYNRMLPALYAGVTGVGILFIGVTVSIIIEQIRSDVRVRADAKQKANDEYIDRLMAEYDGAVKDCAICRQAILEKKKELGTCNQKKLLYTELKNQYENELKKYNTIVKTKEMMEVAKNSFAARYTGPVLQGFKKYYAMMIGQDENDIENVSVNAAEELLVIEKGLARPVDSYSEGNRNMYYLCMRMAYIEAMYKDEKPFIVFDDPFVNLDDNNISGAMCFLKNISKEYQVIYMTCSEGRTI